MLNRSFFKNVLKNVTKVSTTTLKKYARELGVDVKKSTTEATLRNKISKSAKKQYDAYMANKSKEINESGFMINSQGVKIPKKQAMEIKGLQKEMNSKKDTLYKQVVEGSEYNEVEKQFLRGVPVRHTNSSENIELNNNFGYVDYFNSITPTTNLKQFKQLAKEDIDNFEIHDVLQDRSNKLNDWLSDWKQSYQLTDKEVKYFQGKYSELGVIEKSQLNKDLEHKMAMVESVTKNPSSGYDVYHALEELVFKQEDRDFVTNKR